ncbi:MAG: threonine/serine ThrE exporter family protein [Anaerolineae bacterium]
MADVTATTAHHKPAMDRDALRDVISLSLWAGQMLLQNGANTQRVEETVHRLGTALGCDWLDIVILPDAIIASTVNHDDFRTKVRRAPGRGVDMQKISAISDVSYRATRGELDRFSLRQELRRIDQMPRNYPRWLVVIAVGLACASFSRLFGGDWAIFAVTWGASSLAMWVRQGLHNRHFNDFVIVVITAFVAGTIASLASLFNLSPQPTTAIVSSVLLLVPGVPLINSAEDLLHGYPLTGVLRGVLGMLIALSIALGLILSFWLTGVSV